MSQTKPKLIIIDGNALIHRSFHALPPTLRTQDGRLVNAVYGFTAFLLKALNEFRPEYVVLTLDKKGPTFRHKAYAAYKATRVKAPDELYEQIPLVKKVATAFGIPILELDGYEADDLIGTICAQTAAEKKLERVIITGDMDTMQLVNEKTKVYTMSRGLSESVLYGPAEVRARYQLEPDQMIDYKALRGDPSDNIPGVRGIGEKTAGELLAQFKTLDGVYAAAAKKNKKIRERVLELLLASQDDAYLSQKLATIDLRAPIKFRLSDAAFSLSDLSGVIKVFSELEFKSLLVKVKELKDRANKSSDRQAAKEGAAAETAAETAGGAKNMSGKSAPGATGSGAAKFARNEKDFNYQLVDDDKKFSAFFKKLKPQKEFTIDTETSGLDPLTAELLGISFSWKKGEAYFVLASPARLRELKPILADAKIKKYGHNMKFDWRVLACQGVALHGLAFDTMLASYLLNPSNRQHNLDALVFTELGFDKINKDNLAATQPQQLSLDFKGLDPAKLSLYSCEDADFTHRLVKILEPRLKKESLEGVFDKIEMPLIPVLGAMENNGILLETKPLAELNDEVTDKLAKLEKNIYKEAGEKFNINSPKQLQEILFTQLEIPTDSIKKTKTGFSTAEDELEKMRDLHPIIALIQDYREFNKLQTTYLNALPQLINPKDGRIHTSFNQTIAATGRLSSTDPNLQNIPTRTAEGEKIRNAFVAAPGCELAGFDYSQIELRLAAHMSGDKKMIQAFRDGADIHTATAAEINGVAPAAVTKNMRREAKAVNFGLLYGQGPHGLSQGAGIPYWQAGEFIKKYFDAYPGIKKMMDNSIKAARRDGYAVTLFGRKRPLPEINSSIPVIRKSAERMAINTPLQGTAADIIKLAMVKIGELLDGHEDEARMLLQVHDELIFEIKKDKVKTYAPQIQAIMQDVIKLRVPITVDINVGDNWGELK